MSDSVLTPELALERNKGLTFEKFIAALAESERKFDAELKKSREAAEERAAKVDAEFEKSRAEAKERAAEAEKRAAEFDAELKKSREEFDRSMEEVKEVWRKAGERIDRLSKDVGGIGNSLGDLTQAMFSGDLWEKFEDYGYEFTRQSPNVKLYENKQPIAEIDLFYEDGKYVMVVEIKTKLTVQDVDECLKKVQAVRRYMDARNDKRKIVSALASAVTAEDPLKYAHKKGLFVFIQRGDNVKIADLPEGFKPKEW